jgi:hypothetical protein
MKKLLALGVFLLLVISCTTLKRAQTGIARTVGGNEVINVNGHEVYCSQGRVCAEVEVLNISVEDRDGGRVRVVLKNRTGNTALVAIRLEIMSATGEVLTETRPEQVAIPATQEKAYEMPGVYKKGARVRVMLNTAY